MPLFQRAVALDPQFAMAYARLGLNYVALGETAQFTEHFTRAHQLRDRTSEAERYFIDAIYDLQVTGDVERARRTCESWALTYPRMAEVHGFLAAMIYLRWASIPKLSEKLRNLSN